MTFFLVIITSFYNPIPISCALYTPYIHTHMLFSRFYTLLCALVTVHTAYTIYFFLIHHCTNSLSSLHIFVHHCTFCASLHTKTSPAKRNGVDDRVERVSVSMNSGEQLHIGATTEGARFKRVVEVGSKGTRITSPVPRSGWCASSGIRLGQQISRN